MTFTKEEREQRMTFAMIKLHLNCAETMIKRVRDGFVGVDDVMRTAAITFAKDKVIDLYTKFKELS